MNLFWFLLIILVVVLISRLIESLFAGQPDAMDRSAKPRRPKKVIVTEPDQVLSMINDILYRYTGDRYVVKVDTTGWEWKDVQYVHWLQCHPSRRVVLQSIKYG